MDTINVNLENLTQAERDQFMRLIEKSNKEESKSKVWKPKDNEGYWTINTMDGYVDDSTWSGDGDDLDAFRYSIGLLYQTEEEANFAIERMMVLIELQRYADEYNEGEIDWPDNFTEKSYIAYDHNEKTLDISSNSWQEHNSTYFTSEIIALNAITTIGAHRIEKYLFNIID